MTPDATHGFESVYREHHRRVWAFAWRWEGDADRAEELLQEVFLRVRRSLPDFRGNSSTGREPEGPRPTATAVI